LAARAVRRLGIGTICAFNVESDFPGLSMPISTAVVAGVVYYIIAATGIVGEKPANATSPGRPAEAGRTRGFSSNNGRS
jgi:hypothetical protein